MKSIFTLLLAAAAFYLSSCTTNSSPNTLTIIPKADSISVGDTLQISFAGKSFIITDLTILNSPVQTLFAKTQAFDQNDTLYIGQILQTDHLYKTISVNLTVYNSTSSPSSIGTYLVRDNTCTLTDYSEGQNRTYAVSIGSTVNITNSTYPLMGTLSLNLYYDHNSYPATGSFKIYK